MNECTARNGRRHRPLHFGRRVHAGHCPAVGQKRGPSQRQLQTAQWKVILLIV